MTALSPYQNYAPGFAAGVLQFPAANSETDRPSSPS